MDGVIKPHCAISDGIFGMHAKMNKLWLHVSNLENKVQKSVDYSNGSSETNTQITTKPIKLVTQNDKIFDVFKYAF